jgi:hypothetical protein
MKRAASADQAKRSEPVLQDRAAHQRARAVVLDAGKPVLLHRQAGPEGIPKQRSDEIDLSAAWWDRKK